MTSLKKIKREEITSKTTKRAYIIETLTKLIVLLNFRRCNYVFIV